jgi:cysteine dioxygenase
MSTGALDSLVDRLRGEFQGKARPARVGELLGDYAEAHSDWREFAFFSDAAYTRNLVTREARFELLILCWGAGQESPIHNHEGQDCWMAVLDGDIEEVRYPLPPAHQRAPINPQRSQVFGAGQVAFIRDEMGLHLVRPVGGREATGVTLHLYSAPYDECNCYCPDTGLVTRKKLVYFSDRGRILAPSSRS